MATNKKVIPTLVNPFHEPEKIEFKIPGEITRVPGIYEAALKEGFEINPVSGLEMQKIVQQIIATPKPIADRLTQIIGGVEQNTGPK